MVAGLAFIATAIATLFANATAVRWSRSRAPHQGAWTVALALFALASAALATGASTGWDEGTFRVFFLLGAIINVPWLALGTVYLLTNVKVGNRVRAGLLVFTGIGVGVMLATPIHGTIDPELDPGQGSEHLDALPRALAGVGSGVGAIVVFAGAAWSAVRFARSRRPGSGYLAGGNALIALGTLILSSGGLLQGIVGSDEAFAITLAARDLGDLRRLRGRVERAHDAAVVAYDAAPADGLRRERPPEQLARERPGQLVDQLHPRRQLVAREPAARVPQQLDRIGIPARLRQRRTRRRSRRCAGAAPRRRRPRRRRRAARAPARPRPGTR